jgi:hypothetical protein
MQHAKDAFIGAMEEHHGGLVLDTDNGELRVRNQRGLDCMARLDEIPSLRDELASQRDELASQRITISSLQDRVNSLTMSLDAYKLLRNRFISVYKRGQIEKRHRRRQEDHHSRKRMGPWGGGGRGTCS